MTARHRLIGRNPRSGYGDARPALNGVDFALPNSCVTALIGPNGSGKSTLLEMLARTRQDHTHLVPARA